MSSRGHGPVDPGTEPRHTNGGDKHARYGPLGDGEAGVQVTGECPMSYSGGPLGGGNQVFRVYGTPLNPFGVASHVLLIRYGPGSTSR